MLIFLFRSNEVLCQNKQFPWLFCAITFLLPLEKRLISKLHSQNWQQHCDLHSIYHMEVAVGMSCIATINIAVSGAHEKEEVMETELAFTLGLFQSCSSVASLFGLSQWFGSSSWNNWWWWQNTKGTFVSKVSKGTFQIKPVHTQACGCAVRS